MMNGQGQQCETLHDRSSYSNLRSVNDFVQSEFVEHRVKLGIEKFGNNELIGQERNRASPHRATECYFDGY